MTEAKSFARDNRAFAEYNGLSNLAMKPTTPIHIRSIACAHIVTLCVCVLFTCRFRDFYEMWPWKFQNKTNGITPRRWLLLCNRKLANLITSRITDEWITELERLKNLKSLADDPDFLQKAKEVDVVCFVVLLLLFICEHSGYLLLPDS